MSLYGRNGGKPDLGIGTRQGYRLKSGQCYVGMAVSPIWGLELLALMRTEQLKIRRNGGKPDLGIGTVCVGAYV